MNFGIAPLLLVCGLVAGADVDAASVESGTLLKYRGQIVAAEGDPVDSRKKIELAVLVSAVEDSGATLLWSVDEKGHGEWPWPERFGSVRVDGRWRAREASVPTVWYDRGSGKSVVPVTLPLLAAAEPLAVGLTWVDDRLEYEVVEEARVAEQPAWRIVVRSPYGRKRTLLVDKASPLVLALSEVVFMGNGEQYDMTLELAERSTLPAESLDANVAAWSALAKLRDELGYVAGSGRADFSAAQLSAVQAEIPAIERLAAEGPLAALVQAIAEDAKDQGGRNGALAALRKKYLGSETMPFSLKGLKGESLTHDGLKGKVTVLHFWPYLDTPLEEPYGQVGYLDFLHRKRKSEGVAVYGVAVDLRLGDERERRAAMTSVKKLVAFMNLDYPVLLDDGTVLKRFGDPRRADADLPLFVVIGPDGKIAEYHVGYYEVSRDQGLEELNAVLTKLLRNRE